MVRLVDQSKLENIKKAVVSLVVEKGYSNASTSLIAKKSGVSEGYLYRYYKKKYDLVYDVLQEYIYEIVNLLNVLIEKDGKFKSMIIKLIKEIFLASENSKEKIMFLSVLMHDYSFKQSKKLRNDIYDTCINVLQLGKKERSVREDVTAEELFQMVILYPIEFINLRFKNFFKIEYATNKDIKKVTTFILNSLG